jgi:hypothetical protein
VLPKHFSLQCAPDLQKFQEIPKGTYQTLEDLELHGPLLHAKSTQLRGKTVLPTCDSNKLLQAFWVSLDSNKHGTLTSCVH